MQHSTEQHEMHGGQARFKLGTCRSGVLLRGSAGMLIHAHARLLHVAMTCLQSTCVSHEPDTCALIHAHVRLLRLVLVAMTCSQSTCISHEPDTCALIHAHAILVQAAIICSQHKYQP